VDQQDFNSAQRQAFCVFSGKGVSQLRTYLTELFDRITEMNHTDDTEYEEDDFDGEGYDETPEPEGEGRDMSAYPRQILFNPDAPTHRGHRSDHTLPPTGHPGHGPMHEFAFQRDRPIRASTIPTTSPRRELEGSPTTNLQGATSRLNAQIHASTPMSRLSRVQVRHGRTVADVLPIIESSSSQSLSEALPKDPPNADNGSGFFRVYQDRPTTSGVSPRGNRAQTPDLNYAEIGHGRGAQSGSTVRGQHFTTNERTPRPQFDSRLSFAPEPPRSTSSRADSDSEEEEHNTPTPYTENKWTSRGTFLTPETSGPQDSVQSALGPESRGRPEQTQASQTSQPRARGIRNTFVAAEHYASSFLFGRSGRPEASGSGSGSGGGSNTQGSRQR
jgi:F-box and leucine-rich repeat protein GRR1